MREALLELVSIFQMGFFSACKAIAEVLGLLTARHRVGCLTAEPMTDPTLVSAVQWTAALDAVNPDVDEQATVRRLKISVRNAYLVWSLSDG